MSRIRALAVIAASAALILSGCAAYRHRVADDFRDTVKVNVGVGFGLHARIKATSFLDAGFGWGGYWFNAGLEGRHTDFVHPSLNGCPSPIGLVPGAIPGESPLTSLRLANVRGTTLTNIRGVTRTDCIENDYMVAGQLFDGKAFSKWDAYGERKQSPHRVLANDDPTFTEQPCGFEAGAGLILLNVNAGFDPVEFCDLLLTVFGWDFLQDNVAGKTCCTAKEIRATRVEANRTSPSKASRR
jgi:UDP-glucose 6-dehydrogenase